MEINKSLKVMISGCGGMLGEAFFHELNNMVILKASDKDVNADWLEYLDFRDFIAYERNVTKFKPDVLVHLGAYTDLEYCEQNIEKTYDTNTKSVENAVYLANKHNITLVYISTAGIFDGEKEYYDDWDKPNPINIYGRSKYLGELFVKENTKKYYTLRAGWMMGGGPEKDKKFVNKILKQIESGTKELFVVNDKLGTPTYTYDFARNVVKLLETGYYGIYNMVCEGDASRYLVAKEILRLLNLENKIKLNKVSSDFFKSDYYAPRPYSEKLKNTKLKLRKLYHMRDWKVCLSEYINLQYQHLISRS